MADEKFYSKFTAQKNSVKANSKKNNTKKDWKPKEKFSSGKNTGKDFSKTKPGEKKNYSASHSFSYNKINSLFSSKKLDAISTDLLQNFDTVIQNVRPLNSKQIQQLPENVRNLSHQLTDDRASRRLGYMNESIQLSSYVRYYTWWNLVRLTKLFTNLPEESFPSQDSICLDLGSGPLTVVTALWLARPDLRKLNLTWYCLDVSQNSLSLGEDIFLSVASKYPENTAWKIIRVKGSFGEEIRQKAAFITCANMLNELDQASQMPPEFKTKQYFDQLRKYSSDTAKFLLVEPGVPKSARTISLLRDRFISTGAQIYAPCTHCSECPMNGFKAYTGSQNKWCNFAFQTLDAPKKLLKLSEQAKLPKERAVLSFISVQKNSETQISTDEEKNSSLSSKKNTQITVRVTSDEFSLPRNLKGIYACSEFGLILLRTQESLFVSGDEIQINLTVELANLETDIKSGAKVIDIE